MVTQEDLLLVADLDKEIELGNAVKQLLDTPEFKLLYKNYTETLPLTLTYSLGTLDKDQTNTDNVARRLESIALFRQYIEDSVTNLSTALEDKTRILQSGVTE